MVDGTGRDLNGRPVPEAALALARQRVQAEAGSPGVRSVQAPDGARFTLFIPSTETGAGRGARRAARNERFYLNLGATVVASLLFSFGLAWLSEPPGAPPAPGEPAAGGR